MAGPVVGPCDIHTAAVCDRSHWGAGYYAWDFAVGVDREVGSDQVRCGVNREASQGEAEGDAFNIKLFEF